MLFEIFQYGFMQRALISGIAVAVSCSVIGLFLVLRRQSLYGDALSHVAFGRIAKMTCEILCLCRHHIEPLWAHRVGFVYG